MEDLLACAGFENGRPLAHAVQENGERHDDFLPICL
jgi:hypothetical protein